VTSSRAPARTAADSCEGGSPSPFGSSKVVFRRTGRVSRTAPPAAAPCLTVNLADQWVPPMAAVEYGRDPYRISSGGRPAAYIGPGEGTEGRGTVVVRAFPVTGALTGLAGKGRSAAHGPGDLRLSSSYLAATASHRVAMVLMPPPPTATMAIVRAGAAAGLGAAAPAEQRLSAPGRGGCLPQARRSAPCALPR
jgi:hypothetical protein